MSERDHFPIPAPDRLPVPGDLPHSIGGYRLLRRIGEGAMSAVYLGYDPRGLRPVAVKLLADHLAHDRQFVSRFYREARMSRVLAHPHIVRGLAHGLDADAGRHYLILEYVDGPNTMALRRTGPLPIGLAVRIGIQIGLALRYLHTRDYVHRDVKPENILLGPDGTAKLADLGLAKRLVGDMELTTTNQGVGTPHYMPYEQAVNGELVDGRSDLFALGATVYHLLTGRVPFRGETHEEIIREKAAGAYLPAREFRPEVPPILDLILARTLARDPRARFQTAEDWVASLAATNLASGPVRIENPHGPVILPNREDPDVAQTRADLSTDPPPDDPPAADVRPIAPSRRKSGGTDGVIPVRSLGWPVLVSTLLAGLLGVAGVRVALRAAAPAIQRMHEEPADTAGSPTSPSGNESQ